MDQNGNSNWQYNPSEDSKQAPDQPAPPGTAAWQAAEFIEHPHGAGWYGLLVLITIALTALVYLLSTKDYIATATIPIVGVIVGVFAAHKPSIAQYEITTIGLSVNGKTYPYNLFKSFSILHEGSLSSINLFPLKRFMPPVSAYFEPAKEDKITNALGNYLPYEERPMDAIDKLSRRLRL